MSYALVVEGTDIVVDFDNPYWTTKTGVDIFPEDMEYSHLWNTVKFIERKFPELLDATDDFLKKEAYIYWLLLQEFDKRIGL